MAETRQEEPTLAVGTRTVPARAEVTTRLRAGWQATRGLALRLWRNPALRTAVEMWSATRALMIALTWFGVLFSAANSNLPGGHPVLTLHDFIYHWWVWDSGWYVIIATGGYATPALVGFFPLYPALIHVITGLSPHFDPLVVGLIVNNIGTLFAFIAIALLANHDEGDPQAARFTLRTLAAYPFALYLFAAYSEGLFLAGAAWALLAARRGWWWVAIASGMLAGLTRPFGIVLVLPMLWEFGRQHRWWWHVAELWTHRRWWREWLDGIRLPRTWWLTLIQGGLVTLAAPTGIGLYALYCWRAFGDPLLFVHAQQHYNEHAHSGVLAGIITAVQQWQALPSWSYPQARELVDIVPLAACCIVALATFRRIPFAYTLYLLGVCAVCLATPSIDAIFPDVYVSAGRYVLVAIPLFMVVGRWSRAHPWLETLLVQGGWAFQAILEPVEKQGLSGQRKHRGR